MRHTIHLRTAIALFITLLISGFCVSSPLNSVSSAATAFQVDPVAEGLGVPWGMTFIEKQQLLITQRHGEMLILNTLSGTISTVSGLPAVAVVGQGGLLDVVTEPDYSPGGWIYLTYSKNTSAGAATTLARTRLKDNQFQDWQDLLVTQSASDTGRHFGSRIAFDDQGFLYLSIGDRGVRPNGQDLTNHAGSILRLHHDGSIPANNPWRGSNNAKGEIWSYGHRNPQGIAFDRLNRRLWAIEHGPRGGDELNLILPGRNYGWPTISYGKEYWGPFQVGEGTEKPGMEQPVKVYIPSIAPGSLLWYQGDAFPGWRGNLFAGALKLAHLNRITLNGAGQAIAEERLLESLGERIRALATDWQGWIYLSTDSGKILRLRPVDP